MITKPIFVTDLFDEIVLDTQNAVVDPKLGTTLLQQLQAFDNKITGIHYRHGHPKEIIETLTEYGKGTTTKYEKFPLFALFQDFQESIAPAAGFYADVDLHFIIARGTEQNYKADERYEKNFRPVLYPIYFQFLKQLVFSRKFEILSANDMFPHTKIDRLFWGREGLWGNTANSLDDKVDCIEIKIKLRIKTQNC